MKLQILVLLVGFAFILSIVTPLSLFPPCPLLELSARCRDKIIRYSVIKNENDFQELKTLAKAWAPAVKLAKCEKWKPMSVAMFLTHVNLRGGHSPHHLTPSNLPTCNSTCYLKTKESLGCASCTRPHVLRGRHPSRENVPVYVIIRKDGPWVEFTYWFFYPYNRGKRVCIGWYAKNKKCPKICKRWGRCICPRIKGCAGKYSTFGNHVGDFEDLIVRFHNKTIYSIFLSTHNSEITRKFAGEFKWNGGGFQQRGKNLTMHDCIRAVAFSAKGSHGFWPSVGNHVYKRLPNGDTLVDRTSYGEGWNTWQDLRITKWKPRGQYKGQWQFLNFLGRWGNRQRKCFGSKYLGGHVCILGNGPTGP